MKIIITQFNRSWYHYMCACIRHLFKSLMIVFIKRQEYIAEDFNANTIAVTGSPRVCVGPVMTRSPNSQMQTRQNICSMFNEKISPHVQICKTIHVSGWTNYSFY